MSEHSEEQLIECHGCGSLWLIDFADFAKISAKLMECTLCELTKFEEIISKGFKDAEGSQASFMLREEVRRNSEALKFTNSRLLQVERLQEAIYSVLRKGSESGKIANLEATLEKFALNVSRLNDVLGKLGEVEDPLRLAQGQKKLGDYVR